MQPVRQSSRPLKKTKAPISRISNDLRLCATTSTSSRPPDGTGDGYEDEGRQGIQDPQRIERDGELYHKQEEKAR
jgi:hypothetical protein